MDTVGNYINSMMASRKVLGNGCDEALLFHNEGYIAQGSGDNIFIIKNGEVHIDQVGVTDKAFHTRTAVEVLLVRQLGGREIGNGGRGLIAEQRQAMCERTPGQ